MTTNEKINVGACFLLPKIRERSDVDRYGDLNVNVCIGHMQI